MTRLQTFLAIVSALVALTSPLAAELGWNGASTSIAHKEAIKVRKLADPAPVMAMGILEDALEGRCQLTAQLDGAPRRGVRGTVRASLIDANTFAGIETLATTRGRTGKDGTVTYDYDLPRRANFAQQVALVAEVDLKGGKRVTFVGFTCTLADATP